MPPLVTRWCIRCVHSCSSSGGELICDLMVCHFFVFVEVWCVTMVRDTVGIHMKCLRWTQAKMTLDSIITPQKCVFSCATHSKMPSVDLQESFGMSAARAERLQAESFRLEFTRAGDRCFDPYPLNWDRFKHASSRRRSLWRLCTQQLYRVRSQQRLAAGGKERDEKMCPPFPSGT